MSSSITIAARFCGPDGSGNGGYSAGRFAGAVWPGDEVEVTLRRPPPLERPLLVVPPAGDAGARLLDGAIEVAQARRAPVELGEVPARPSFDEAVARSAFYVGHHAHAFPHCFVCGTARAVGDGLRLFAGRETDSGPVAAPFVPDASLADADGAIPPEIAWAALDCPGYFGVATPGMPYALLGRMSARLSGALRVGERAVVVGFGLGREGRKLFAGTVLYGGDGREIGRSRQVWITLPA